MATVKEMYQYLKAKGLNDFAVSGVFGNLDKESGCLPNNLQNTFNTKFQLTDAQYTARVDNGTYKNFVGDHAGYGLAQWTSSDRKKGLLDLSKERKVSIADPFMQIDYLWMELHTSYFAPVLKVLLNATSVQEASDIFLTRFEAPANAASKKAERTAAGMKFYEKYADKAVVKVSGTNNFTPRLTEPSTSDKHWIHVSKGGLNECILISGNSCVPNCVGYAWGRFYEIIGKRPTLSRANAEMWYGNTADGYKRSQTPALGAVICWSKGKVGVGSDGAGHVAIVEQIKPNGDIVTSNSGYRTKRFWTQTFKKANGYGMNGYKFQGFILPPNSTPIKDTQQPAVSTPTTPATSSVNYRVKISATNLRIRKSPTTDSAIVSFIDPGVYTITAESTGKGATKWGKLKSGRGWVSLDYCKKL